MPALKHRTICYQPPASMHSRSGLIALLVVSIVWLTGCAEKIDLDLVDTYSRIVVEASVSNRMDMHMVVLSRTANYFSSEATPRVEGATVSISKGSNRWILAERMAGMYIPAEKFSAEPGQEYHLEIHYDGVDYRASSVMPDVPEIDSLTLQRHSWNRDNKELIAHFQDPANTRDYYMWKVFLNGKDITNPIGRARFISDEVVNGQYLSMPFFTFRDDEQMPKPGDTIRVEMHGITEDYYLFLDAMRRNQGTVGGPFTGPPANIPGNIDNGALGFFLVSNISEIVVIVGDN
jgi:hypothetical protein